MLSSVLKTEIIFFDKLNAEVFIQLLNMIMHFHPSNNCFCPMESLHFEFYLLAIFYTFFFPWGHLRTCLIVLKIDKYHIDHSMSYDQNLGLPARNKWLDFCMKTSPIETVHRASWTLPSEVLSWSFGMGSWSEIVECIMIVWYRGI